MVGTNRNLIIKKSLEILRKKIEKKRIPKLWDGMAARRIVDTIVSRS